MPNKSNSTVRFIAAVVMVCRTGEREGEFSGSRHVLSYSIATWKVAHPLDTIHHNKRLEEITAPGKNARRGITADRIIAILGSSSAMMLLCEAGAGFFATYILLSMYHTT